VTQSSKVVVVNDTDVPVTSVSDTYPVNPMITSVTALGGTITLTTKGLTAGSYLQNWWIDKSIDLVNWTHTTNATLSGNLNISFPQNPQESKCFYRIMGFKYMP
jgi:hypothetical protein